ncbi:unnamed protein product [Caenorhabditis sp. 36 PRJEB53466]|nr:unnamed protein product [Caenorhabditis sp. 36 PRJEB53466]
MSSQFPRIILLSLFIFSALSLTKDSAPITDDPWDLDGPCQKYVEKFAVVQSEMVACATNWSIPPKVCTNCFQNFINFKQFEYETKHLDNVFSLDNRTCSQVIYDNYLLSYSSDISTALTSKIWEQSRCDSCIKIEWNFPANKSEVHFSDNTLQFQNLLYEWRNCVVNYTSEDVFDHDLTNGSKICNLCKSPFNELFGYYWKIYITPDVDFCVDVETTMNDTIHLWNDVWQCAEKQDRNRDLAGIMITFATLLLLTALFYAASYIQGGGQTRNLVRYSRLDDPRGLRSRLLSSGMTDADYVHRASPDSSSSIAYNVPIKNNIPDSARFQTIAPQASTSVVVNLLHSMGQDDEDDAQMLQAKQQITFNVINKRKDQLRRWQSSEMNAEPSRRMKRPKVQFQDSDIFLSACMSGDEEEVEELLLKGADINTCTVDGLTALHQSVIDSKPDMVRFLCEKGADVNAQDNEGWTPLHAAACCGNVAIVRYLCQHGADLSIVNSDKELALDLAVDEQCREYLEDDYKRQMIDLEACREQELHTMLRDVKSWISTGEYKDVPHPRTGGTAVHVAAGRGYTQLLEMLIKAGGNVRAQDKDGWTPLHAAAHWAERDACKMLLENGAELSDLTFSGIDVLGVADKECVDYIVELADTVKAREKRKSPAGSLPPASVLQEKNARTPSHEEHVLSSERKRDLQHQDQHSENEFLHSAPSTGSTSSANTTTTTTIVIGDSQSVSRESLKDTAEDEECLAEDEMEAEEEEEGDQDEEETTEEISEMESRNGKETTVSEARTETSRSLSVSRSLDGYSERSSAGRESSVETSEAASEPSRSVSVSTSNSSRFVSSSTSSSQRSASVASSETPRSSLESSSVGSGDQTVSATVPIAPSTAPPKAIHQSPSSWINRGFPLSSRSSSASVTRSSSTPASEIISPPASLHSQHSFPSSSVAVPSSSTTVTPTSVPSTPVSNIMAATISSSAKNTPSPAGSVTITATFSKPSRWQSKTVTESEAERRNNSRMQRQHRRSTQGVTKEQLEEASKFATDETIRRNSQLLSTTPSTLQVRLASEEKDLSSTSEEVKDGDVTTSATVSLANSPNSNAANVRRKSQGLSISRSNRRATGPVNPEDLVQLRPHAMEPSSPAMSLRLATASISSQPYSPASIRSNAGTLPTVTSRFSEKAQSLPPATNGTPSSQSLSSRSAVVAGLSAAPSMRSAGVAPLSATASSRFLPSSSLSSNSSSNPTGSYALQSRPTETNLNYKALFEKERTECDRLRREVDDLRRSQTADTWRGNSTTPAWRTRNASPSAQPHNLSVAKSTSLASFDENERRSMERKIADLELQLKTSQNLRMENQRLKEENGALVRVISKMTI